MQLRVQEFLLGTPKNPVPIDVCHDLEAVRRTTTGTCPVHGRYTVYEEYIPGEDWVPIGSYHVTSAH